MNWRVTARFSSEAARHDEIFVSAFFSNGPSASLRRRLLLGSALCASVAPTAAQTFVGNDFSPASSLLSTMETIGFKDSVPPFVILPEYDPSGPATTGAIFGSAGTVNAVTF